MKWTELKLKTLKEKPAGTSLESHSLLVRSGCIYSTSQGIFTYNTLFLRAIQKLEKLIRQELEKQGCREILMPMVQPKNLWQETNRWDKFEGLLQKMTNRSHQEFCLGPTHEEVITDFVRSSLTSYKEMPLNLYQIQTKFRDEIRPRFGLMRAKEFIMKDAYSFDKTEEEASQNYKKMFQAYKSIFKNLDVNFVVVQADSGSIGGDKSEEFHVLAEQGEDRLLVSSESDFAANREICPSVYQESNNKESSNEESRSKKSSSKKSNNKESKICLSAQQDENPIEEFKTPNIKTIKELAKFLQCKERDLVKILFFVCETQNQTPTQDKNQAQAKAQVNLDSKNKPSTQKPTPLKKYIAVLCLGDDEINLIKIKKNLNLVEVPYLASNAEVQEIAGASPGSCGPYQLKKDIEIYLDQKLKNKKNFVTGANKDNVHLKNINPNRDFKVTGHGDFCYSKAGEPSPCGKGILKEYRGIEVGHLFYLNDTYSKKMNLTFLDQNGKKQFVKMGCYGLGVTRTLQSIVEQNHDKDGIVWPLSVAPFAVHICLIDEKDPSVLKALSQVTQELESKNLDYFIDDRKQRPGIKFKDADLLGLPIRLSLGSRDLKNEEIDYSLRASQTKEKIKLTDLSKKLSQYLQTSSIK